MKSRSELREIVMKILYQIFIDFCDFCGYAYEKEFNMLSYEDEIKENYRILYSHCTNEQRRYVNQLRKRVNIEPEWYGLVSFEEGLMSMQTYCSIRNLITFPKETIVVDCGCNLALQQVLFQDCKQYIGIDFHVMSEPMFKNSILIQGDISDILPALKLDGSVVGVSVLCCSYFKGDVLKVFKEKFDKLITI